MCCDIASITLMADIERQIDWEHESERGNR